MAATLQQILLAPDTQPQVIADCFNLIEQQVSDKSGISGTAVKLAYKTVNTFMPGHVRNMVGKLLPDMVDQSSRSGRTSTAPAGPGSATTWPSGVTRWRRRCCP